MSAAKSWRLSGVVADEAGVGGVAAEAEAEAEAAVAAGAAARGEATAGHQVLEKSDLVVGLGLRRAYSG